MDGTPRMDQVETRIRQALESAVQEAIEQFVTGLREAGLVVGEIQVRAMPPRVPSVRALIVAEVGETDFMTSSQLADALTDRIVTKSDDPRRVVLSTISALCREGVLSKDPLGRLSLHRKEVDRIPA